MDSFDKKLQGFQLIAQEKLQAILCSIPGKKDLIISPTVIKPLEHVCNASWLKLKGIQKIYRFDTQIIIPYASDHVQVFMLRGDLCTFQAALRHVQEHQMNNAFKNLDNTIKPFHIICIPSCYAYYPMLLEEKGLYGLVQLHRYNWDFIYIDDGVLSLEHPKVFCDLFLHNDTSPLPAIAQSLRLLQIVCGRPDLILTYGEHSNNILKMFDALPHCFKENETTQVPSAEFSALIIVDRDKDYASSLLTPAIYSGLLLEVFNNRTSEVVLEQNTNKILQQKLEILELPVKNSTTNEKPNEKPTIIRLKSVYDEIYGENRYKHFAQAISLVRAQAKAIGLEVQKLNDMKLDEMHDYVARKLPKVNELKIKVMRHLNASEKIIEMLAKSFRKLQTLEENILNNVSRKRLFEEIDFQLTFNGQRYNTLRLFCLLHLCAGVNTDELQQFMRNYCNYFGAKYLYVFDALANGGLLPALVDEEKVNKSTKLLSNLPIPKFQQTEFQANANRMKLLTSVAGVDAANNPVNAASCPSYVFNNNYIPLVAQLCSLLLKTTTADDFANKLGMMDKINLLAFDTKTNSYTAPLNIKSYGNAVKLNEIKDWFPLRKPKIFIYVVGGITYAEIGACELIGKLSGAHIVAASDSIISGADLIAQAF
ncbi:vacuolar protein sorting-associated protein 33B [Teleopsis dalmanni]|uniref:vacuolar protein sorting-associated protein 33B n=1 Tax=Teleopsis dalmanni TaxID=139649 RepID=UPI000D32B97A|nr:vacuolar protein sorting-associated protein 33B [Teleopsis dalmanni]XP_037952368.1 vacuolar protein sorting-associated protein 33B [Teleopsis dalmanni]